MTMLLLLFLVGSANGFYVPHSATKGLAPLRAEKETVTAGGFNTAGEPPIEIRGFSLAKSFLGVGATITIASFTEFFTSQGQAGLSSIGFIYGIPILLIGLALQYAELEPVAIEYTGDEQDLEKLWEDKATETMLKIRQDVTRHRYGDEAHLDTTVKALGLVPQGKPYPQLKYLQLSNQDKELQLAMIFSSPETPFNDWNDPKRIEKYNTFFGPGCTAQVQKVDAEKRLVAIQLTTTD